MTLLYTDERFFDHDTGTHPECGARMRAILSYLGLTGVMARCQQTNWSPSVAAQLATVHELSYVAEVERFAATGGGRIEVDTVVSPASFDVAKLAAGAACDATRHVVGGNAQNALCLVRPPGHHALPHTAMGFCLFANVSLAARLAIDELGLNRVLIVDWDVHHGNGTQDVFWEDEQVSFFSIHRFPFYPGTGATDETGSGKGLGTTFNLPVKMGTARREYLDRFGRELDAFATRMRPELVILSAGFDAHVEDPVGSLGLETEDFAELSKSVLAIARAHCGGKLVSVLEGGYNPERLAESVGAHLEVLLEGDPTIHETPPKMT
jgi:acetoin utilization deacetylase AcuC-like enzyme